MAAASLRAQADKTRRVLEEFQEWAGGKVERSAEQARRLSALQVRTWTADAEGALRKGSRAQAHALFGKATALCEDLRGTPETDVLFETAVDGLLRTAPGPLAALVLHHRWGGARTTAGAAAIRAGLYTHAGELLKGIPDVEKACEDVLAAAEAHSDVPLSNALELVKYECIDGDARRGLLGLGKEPLDIVTSGRGATDEIVAEVSMPSTFETMSQMYDDSILALEYAWLDKTDEERLDVVRAFLKVAKPGDVARVVRTWEVGPCCELIEALALVAPEVRDAVEEGLHAHAHPQHVQLALQRPARAWLDT